MEEYKLISDQQSIKEYKVVLMLFCLFQRTIEKRLSKFMREGHWFVSLYNDFGDAQTIDLVAALSLEMTEGCPNGCNGHGECVLGRCQCEAGYNGEDCSQGKIITKVMFCTVLLLVRALVSNIGAVAVARIAVFDTNIQQ